MLVTCFQKFIGKLNTPYSKRAGKIISFYIKVFSGIELNLPPNTFCHAQHAVSRHAYVHFCMKNFRDSVNPVMYAHLSLFGGKKLR